MTHEEMRKACDKGTWLVLELPPIPGRRVVLATRPTRGVKGYWWVRDHKGSFTTHPKDLRPTTTQELLTMEDA